MKEAWQRLCHRLLSSSQLVVCCAHPRQLGLPGWKSVFAHLVFLEASMLGASVLEEEDWNVVIVYLVMQTAGCYQTLSVVLLSS